MDDFKLNAEKIIAAQKAKSRRAQSPETESNWDSSEAEEENTVTQISSDEEFSIKSSRSHKSSKAASRPGKADASKTKTSSKPDVAATNKKIQKPAKENASVTKGTARAGVSVFVDRGGYDSDEVSQKSTAKKPKKKKEENPPYDFRKAIRDEDDDTPSQTTGQRPGRSRKGQDYDPTPPVKQRHKPQKEQFPDEGSWDDSDENEKALAQIRRERDGLPEQQNNSNQNKRGGANEEPRETETLETPEVAEEKESQKKKRKGWSLSVKSRSKEKKKKEERAKEPKKELEVAMVTPPVQSLKHSEVEVSYRKEMEEEVDTIISMDTDDQGTRYVYIYHHGSPSYCDTRPSQEAVYMTTIADRSERIFRRCAREIFATLRILVDFFLIFLLEGLRFLAFNIVSAVLVGFASGCGDYFLRPVATAVFNGLCQPTAMFWFNVGVALRTAVRPFLDVLQNFLAPFAMLVRAFRLVEVNQTKSFRTPIEDV